MKCACNYIECYSLFIFKLLHAPCSQETKQLELVQCVVSFGFLARTSLNYIPNWYTTKKRWKWWLRAYRQRETEVVHCTSTIQITHAEEMKTMPAVLFPKNALVNQNTKIATVYLMIGYNYNSNCNYILSVCRWIYICMCICVMSGRL